MYGPDLEPITASVCLMDRLQHRCEPEFIQLLTRPGMDASLPQTEQAPWCHRRNKLVELPV